VGFDVFGKNPKNETGKYFRNNVWWWHPLWEYCCQVAPDIAGKVTHGHSNDGDGLDDEDDALALARRLREELESGRTKEYERQYAAALEALPDEPCRICGGTGGRQPPPQVGPGDVPCNGCSGTGKVRPFVTNCPFSKENVREFVEFLENCGGFEIW